MQKHLTFAAILILSILTTSPAIAQSPSIEVRPLLEGTYLFFTVVDENMHLDAFDALSALSPLEEESVIFALDQPTVEMLGLQPVESHVWMLDESGACVAPVGEFVAISDRGSDDPAFTIAAALETCTSGLDPIVLLSDEDLSALSWHPAAPFTEPLTPELETWRTDVSNLSEESLDLLAWQTDGAEAGTHQFETDFSIMHAGGPEETLFVLYRQWLSIEGPDFSPSCANTVEVLDGVGAVKTLAGWIVLADETPTSFRDAGVIMSGQSIQFVVWEDAVGEGPASSNLGLMFTQRVDDGSFSPTQFIQTYYGHGEWTPSHPLEEWRCLP